MKISKTTALVVLVLLAANFAFSQRGKEGNVTITGNTTVNTYTFVTANVAVGASSISVNNATMVGGAFSSVLGPGDLIMIVQMQGATMDINTTPTVVWGGNYTVPNDYFIGTWDANPHYWGQVTDYGTAGNFERVEVLSVVGNVINLNCQLTKAYAQSGHVQVIRIPRYDNLTVPLGTSIIAPAWNGNTGGVVAIEVRNALVLNGSISATGTGFRGGQLDPVSNTAGGAPNSIRRLGSNDNFEGSEKGEGIGGYVTEYTALFSRFGIGAPANGGGGGGYQNSGGGGGSNVLVGGTYTSKGTPIGYTAVWNLEAAGFGGSTSAGGGRGGYAISDVDQNELVVGPANALWGGDDRKNTGGFGGHPLPFVADRVFAGGGGGAGDQDSGQGGAGGNGGGLVFIQVYGATSGSGTVEAQGAAGQNTNPTNAAPTGGSQRKGVDGAGGGGAGGSIHIENISAIPASITLNVRGGNGGNQNITLLNVSPLPPLASEAGGPGGSGAGGLIRIGSGAPTKIFAAGTPGVTNSSHMVNFPPNGATSGSNGFNPYPNNPTYNINTTNQTICAGSSITLTATISGTGSPLPTTATLVWYASTVNGVGGTQVGTGPTFTTPVLATTTTYWVGRCPGTFRTPVTVTVLPPDNASFSYTGSPFCTNGADPTPTITGLAGGTFSSTAGLSINASTGTIDVSASTPGIYTVTYLTNGPCPASSTQSVTISAVASAAFSYAASSYCINQVDPTPTITGAAGGTFSSTAGLSINATTGTIDLSASTPGGYTVTYTTGGACPNSATFAITITTLENANFNYSAASYCISGADPTPTITGVSGGTFSSTAGLSINASTGAIDVSASTPGAYTVTYTSGGACPNSSTQSVTITALDNAAFSYSAASYCVNAADPTPTITGVAGGTFTSTAGLSINASTGAIDVSASTPGIYTVTYTTIGACSNSSNVSVTIVALDNAGFNYSAAAYCVNASDPTPTITGAVGGTFSSTAGLSINASTGAIDVSASTPGFYTITYTTSGTCPNSSTQSVTINALDNASFSYSAASYCVNGSDPTPTISGLAGGTFSSTAGLSINASTGTIDVSASTPGFYTVTYTTSGTCPNSATFALTIVALDNAGFNYSAAAYCVNAADPSPTITGLAGGTFSSTAGLSINASTGTIDVSASTPGTYSVTYTTSGACPNSSSVSVTINALDNAGFNYSSPSYCVSGADPTPTITGVAGGTFSSTAGLSINAATGIIDVSASTPGAYSVTYTTSGACPNSSSVAVSITALDDASFSYSAASYCVNALDPSPTLTGVSGGTYSSTAGLSINASTGVIDVSASTPGTYTVTYATSGTCANSSNVSVTINALDNAGFNYSAAAYCVNGTDPTPTITGVVGGTFSSTAGLSINASTGIIDVSASTPGTYSVTYTTNGTCPNSSSVSVTINALDNAGFTYSSPSYCLAQADPTPTITGLAGGTFSSTAGLSINASTGTIDVSASTPGAYTVTYTTNGACPNSSTFAIGITALDDASFSYAAAAYCLNDIDPTPTITGVAGGTFSSTAGLSINASTGVIDVSASTPGTYTVTYSTSGICANSSTVSVTITALDNAGFNYSAAAYCVNAVDPTPTITGLAGGTFSSTAGLSINASTGAIDVSASTPGTYSVTYTTSGSCPNSSIVSITINALDNAGFNYAAASYCVSSADPTPTITGLAGGIFSSTAGLSINASTGTIDVSASTPGAYTVTYSTAGSCPNSSTYSVTIIALDNASFSYGAAAYCVNAIDPTPTITGLAGGSFSSTAGLSINATTGAIDVSASTPGTYSVTYTTAGTCPNTSSVSVTINALDNAGFNYSAASYCVNAIDPTPTITGLAGGTFSSTAGLSMNAATGAIDVSASTPGTYSVTYTTSGSCPNSSNVSVTITALDNAGFSYSAASYCVSGSDPTPTITGLAGGTFSSTAGLSINATTGVIDVSASTLGGYTVTYLTSGACPNSSTFSVTITAIDDASFSYGAAAYCVNAIDPTPTITGIAGGTFSSTAGLSINATTGAIDVSASTPNTYTITYTTVGACPNSSNVSVTINALDNAGFNYSAASYCVSAVDPTPTISGLSGGSFASTAGLSINATTGQIDVSASTPGAYVITYTTAGSCPNSSTVNVTINALDNASFSYPSTAYCVNAVDPIATISGLAGGTFTSTAGLIINAATGTIDVSASTPGTYSVTYTTSGTCPNTSNVSVTINALDNAGFNYSAASYCVNASDPTPTISGLAGGTFSSGAGLSINGTTGQIDVSASTPGAYTVTYLTSGTCPNSSTASVTINALDNASFNYSAATYCVSGSDPTPTISGLAGGTFSSTAGLSINAATGTIDVSASTVGTYSVTYTTNGSCPTTSSVSVTILATDNSAFTMTATCDGGTASAPVTTGGVFSFVTAPPAGVTIDATTGTVSGGTSGATYTVQYTTSGACASTSTANVTVLTNPVIDAIANQVACDQFVLPAITGTGLSGSEAFYSNSQAGGGVVIAGPITSTQTVYVFDSNAGCTDEISFVVTINITEDPTFSLTNFCEGSVNSATISGTSGGTFNFNPAVSDGATINATTGGITGGVAGTIYSVEYTTAGACPANSIETVEVYGIPTAPIVSANQTYCAGDVIAPMTASTPIGTLNWYDDFGLTNNIGTGTSLNPYSFLGSTTYYVTATENGCEGPESAITILIEECEIIIPTAITPDGDGANDDWELMNIDAIYPNNTVQIYNRWGNLIFESPQGDYDNNRWDGTFKGELLPVASYYFIINPNEEGVENKSGSVSIILGN